MEIIPVKRNTTRCMTAALTLLLVLFAGDNLQSADWPTFRGPGGSGISEDTGLPTSWSTTEHVVWKTALPGFGASSPITLGDKVFLTCYSGYGLDVDEPGDQADLLHHVTCLDRATGEILWNRKSQAAMPESEYRRFVDLHGYASGTPVTDGETVYVFFGRSGAWAYALEGELLWKVNVGTGLHGWGSGTSPILAGNLVIVNASVESESVVALDKKTGEKVWRVRGIKDSWSTPALVDLPDGKQELVVSMHSSVRGYDPATGEELWTCAGVPDYVCPMVVVNGDIVYISGGRKPTTLAVRAGGRGDVTETHRLWTLSKATKVPSPLYHDGLLYWLDNKGIACCVDAESGELVYQERLRLAGSGDVVYSSLVLGDGKLYGVSRQGETVVLAPGREFQELARNDLGDESVFNATPAISNGQLLLRSDKFLYCVGQ